MKKSYKIDISESKKIRGKMKTAKKASIYKKLEAVALLSEGKTPAKVSEITKIQL